MGFHDWIIERQQLLERIKELEVENAELKKRLGEDVTPLVHEPAAMQKLSAQEKVELFRSLFKGREDVFARRWYSKASGKGDYHNVIHVPCTIISYCLYLNEVLLVVRQRR